MTTYRCSVCQSIVVDDTDIPVCNRTSRCGLLFDYEVVTTPAPPKRLVKFSVIGGTAGLLAGDVRDYEVLYQGRMIGTIQRVPGLLIDPDDESKGFHADPFCFSSLDGTMVGEGTTRYAAVVAAYEGVR